jgi:O-antigen/teichoic acid export membrane protein
MTTDAELPRDRPATGSALRARADAIWHRARGATTDALWAFVAEATTLFCTLVTFALLTSKLGPSAYGQYIGMYALLVFSGGLTYSWVFLTVFQRIVREGDELDALVRSALSIISIGIGIALAIIAIVGPTLIKGVPRHTLLYFAVAEWCASAAVQINTTMLQAIDGVAVAVRNRIVQPLVRVSVVLLLVTTERISLDRLAVLLLAANGALTAFMLYRLHRRFHVHVRPGRIERAHLRDGSMYAATFGGFTLQEDGEKTLLNTFNYSTDAGIYSAAFRIVQFGIMPVTSLLISSHKRFLMGTDKRNEHVRRALRFTGVAVAYAGAFVIFVELFAQVIADLLPGDKFDQSATIMRVVAPLVVLRAASHFAYNGLLGLGKYRARVVVILSSSLTALAIYLAFIPHYSWKGGAAGTLVGEAVFGVVAWTSLIRHQRRHDDELSALPLDRRLGVEAVGEGTRA